MSSSKEHEVPTVGGESLRDVDSVESNVSLESLDSEGQESQIPMRPETSRKNSALQDFQQNPYTLYDAPRSRSRAPSGSSRQHIDRIQSSKSSILGLNENLQVPRKNRRGLLAQFTVIGEYENARLYPNKIKLLIVFVVACCAVIGPMGTSILMPAIDAVAEDLHSTLTIVNISVGVYLFTLGFFPLYWSSYSEAFGRRSVYVVSFILFACFSIGCALASSVGMLIAFRILSGAAAASVQSVGAGTISDLYPPQERGRAMGIYYLGPLGGPLFAPIIGGALGQGLGWRSTQWFLCIFGGCCCFAIVFLLPETLRKEDNREAIRKILAARRRKPRDIEEKADHSSEDVENEQAEDEELAIERIATHQSVRSIQRSLHLDEEEEEVEEEVADHNLPAVSRIQTQQKSEMLEKLKQRNLARLKSKVEELDNRQVPETKWAALKRNSYFFLVKPLKSVVFLRYPPVLLALIFAGPLFSITYFLNLALSNSYSAAPYNFSEVIVGLVYIPNSVSYIIASIWGGKWTDKLLRDYADKHNGELAPEARIGVNVWLAAALFPISLLIFGWCLDKETHWVTPLIGTFIFGFASMIVIGTTVTYLVDSLPGRGATGVALNNLVRMTLATVACFVTEPLANALGLGVLFSILAGISAVLAVILVFLRKYGTYWRETYDLGKLYDLLD